MFGCNANYLDYSQHIRSADGKFNYCLYLDGVGIGDPGFYVLKLDSRIDPKTLRINWNYKTGVKPKDSEWIERRQILYNYDEAGFLTSNPKIEIINGRHLVFSRGGYYFALYDLKLNKDIFNMYSPWNVWNEGRGYRSEKYDEEKEEQAYKLWVKRNLNDRIQEYVLSNK